MKFIYLLCLSFIIFNYVKAEEEDNFDDAENSLHPREYYESSTPDKQPILPPRPPNDYPTYDVEVSTIPSLKDKLGQAKKDLKNKVDKVKKKADQFKKKVVQTKKKFGKDMKDKVASIKQKKLEKVEKPKTTTPEPFVVYERVKVHKKTVNKKVKKPKKSMKCRKIEEALFG
uniref:Uncharacterized protein n=1 Tax=Tetranychus urticae TaxID=32264 RepID=T1JYN3_TETUR